MYEPLRTFVIDLMAPGNLAVLAGRMTFQVMKRMRITDTQLSLNGTGTGAGATTVVIKKNGVAIGQAADLSIAGASAVKTIRAKPNVGVGGEPSGVYCEVGDLITVDITAIPVTTTSTDGVVYLECAAIEA